MSKLKRIFKRSGVRLSPKGRRYDWRPDTPDFRDKRYKITAPLPLPDRVDLRPKMPPVVNQGDIGSCTSNALAGCLEYLQQQELGRPGKEAHEYSPDEFYGVSRLFIYWNERDLEGTLTEDAGGEIRDGIKSLWQKGACRESLWDYSRRNLFRRPTTEAFIEASGYVISSYERCNSLYQMKAALAEGFPVAFGFMVYESFESDEVARTGKMPMPRDNERDLGGHAVCAVGYDDHAQILIVRNSWGTDWGDAGYFYMPMDYIEQPDLSDDYWVIRG
jgi:C1A family cysteine protease